MNNYINNDIVNGLDKVFECINQYKYDEAYYYLLQNTDNTKINPYLKEWVQALNEFHIYDKKIDAINILEKIRPNNIKNAMDFRIYNSLLGFYLKNNNNEDFCAIANIIKDFLRNNNDYVLLRIKSLYNLSNGYYTFNSYDIAVKYAQLCINECIGNQIILKEYLLSIVIKISSYDALNDFDLVHKEIKTYNDYKFLGFLLGDQEKYIDEEINKILKKRRDIL
jgi:hypothetical protein